MEMLSAVCLCQKVQYACFQFVLSSIHYIMRCCLPGSLSGFHANVSLQKNDDNADPHHQKYEFFMDKVMYFLF